MRQHRSYTYRPLTILIIFILVVITAGCSPGSKSTQNKSKSNQYNLNDVVMSTVLLATVYGEKDLTGSIKESLDRLEREDLSWRIEDSQVAKVNQAGKDQSDEKVQAGDKAQAGEKAQTGDNLQAEDKIPSVSVSDEFYDWTARSLELADKSEGAFDPSIGELTRLWDIEGENPKVPEEKALKNTMKRIGYEKIHLNPEKKEIAPEGGVTLDLGAVGKGIACDRIKELLDEDATAQGEDTGTQGAIVSVGGSILVYGKKPDGEKWTVAIQDPRGPDGEYMGVLSLDDTTVVSTSGDYEKYFMENGKRYHHILDPHTGYPAESGLISVTVVCENGLLSDGLSTACFVLGKERGLKLLEEYGAEGVIIDKDKKVTVTDGLQKQLTILNDSYKLMKE